MKDALLTFANRVQIGPIAVGAGDVGDIVQMDSTKEYAIGTPIPVVLMVNIAAVGLASSTTTFSLQTDNEVTFTSPTTLWTGATLVSDNVPADVELKPPWRATLNFLPEGNRGYLKFVATVAGANLTTCTMSAYIPVGAAQRNP
jgi:hypothetical protein